MKTFELVAKKARRKRLALTLLLSLILVMGSLFAGHALLTKRLHAQINQASRYYHNLFAIAYPNIAFYGDEINFGGAFTATYQVNTQKNIAGITLSHEQIGTSLGLWDKHLPRESYRLTTDRLRQATYTSGQGFKSPVFYNTAYPYTPDDGRAMIVTQDIRLWSQFPGQALEMAVTFERPYSFEEIAELVPDDLQVNWYWIGTQSKMDTSTFHPAQLLGFAQNPYLVRDGLPVDQKALDSIRQASFQQFRADLEQALEQDWLRFQLTIGGQGTYRTSKDARAYLKANPDSNKAQFAGVILTGRAEDFASLENQSWIFGSNIGQHIEIQPYHILSIE